MKLSSFLSKEIRTLEQSGDKESLRKIYAIVSEKLKSRIEEHDSFFSNDEQQPQQPQQPQQQTQEKTQKAHSKK